MTIQATSQQFTRPGYWLRLLLVGWLAIGSWPGLSPAARAQAWQKAVVSLGAAGQYRVASTAVDALGNVYLAGSFSGTVQFGASTLVAYNKTNAFVAKWSSAANAFAWGQQVSGTGSDYATAVAVQGSYVYLAGTFDSPTAGFGAISLPNAGTLASDVFVAKLLDAGGSASFVWAQRAGGRSSETEAGLVVNGTSLYITGNFFGQAGFGTTTLLAGGGSSDIFVAKLVDAGATASFSWAQAAGGSVSEGVTALAGQGSSLYLTGYFTGPTASFGAITLANASTPSTYDVFVAKLVDEGSGGRFAWAQQAGGTARDVGYAIAVSGTSVYVAGVFEPPTARFGSLVLTPSTTTSESDAFVAKLTDAGNASSFGWVQQVGGPGYELPMGLASTGVALYLTGYFNGPTATFGPTTLTTRGSNDLFVARLSDAGPAGAYNWVQQAGGAGSDFVSSLAVRGTNVYIGGTLTLPATFGSQVLSDSNPSATTFTGYWAQLTDTFQPLATAASVSAGASGTIFPNPAHAAASVRIAATAGASLATLTVLDATGQVVRTQQVALPAAETVATLPLPGLAPGLYHVLIQTNGWHTIQALVIE